MKKCLSCKVASVSNPDHDLCSKCWMKLEQKEGIMRPEERFEDGLESRRTHTVYIMFYGPREKIGYTPELGARIVELHRKYPHNQLVYFREFTSEAHARRYEAWLKTLSQRQLNKIICDFQDKMQKVKIVT